MAAGKMIRAVQGNWGKEVEVTVRMPPSSWNILLAVDGSENAQAAVAFLCDLPRSQRAARERCVTVLPLFPKQPGMTRFSPDTALLQIERDLTAKGYQVAIVFLAGVNKNPAAAISTYAARHSPDFIVLGITGLQTKLGLFLGGVIQTVVENSCLPILIAKAPSRALQRILLATDGSASSQDAVEFLCGSPRCPPFPFPGGATCQVVHVLPTLPASHLMAQVKWAGPEGMAPLTYTEITALSAEEERQGQLLLAQTSQALKASGIEAGSALLRGDAADRILEYIALNQVDLVVAGSRGLNPMTGWLLGSVSRKLIHYAGCSVLIVKTPGSSASQNR